MRKPITAKQRSYLRGLANTTQPILQVGKNGINENLIKQIDDALEARELVKITVLETAPESAREACAQLAGLTNAEQVQVIGFKFVLYRESKDNKKIQLPR